MNEQQREAARLLGQGYGSGEIARRLGVSSRTVVRWKQLPGFTQAVAVDAEPTVRSTLEAALLANKRDGSPDHAIRVSAAKALAALGPEAPTTEPTTIVIYQERT